MKKQLLIAGGTGLIGTALSQAARSRGWEVTILSRSAGPGRIMWDPEKEVIDIQSNRPYDAIINLAGASIAGGRWTVKRKAEIRSSRIRAGRTLEKYLLEGKLQTAVYIGVSGVGIYGHREAVVVDDSSPIDISKDWFLETTRLWEESHHRIAAQRIRSIVFRLGIVLSPKGGALKELLKTAVFGFVPFFGSGKQFWPWIHIDDVVKLFFHALQDENMKGTYLACAPRAVSNRQLAHALAKSLQPGRLVLPAPACILKLMLGEMHRVLLDSCHGYPSEILKTGFQFRFTDVKDAMKDLVGR